MLQGAGALGQDAAMFWGWSGDPLPQPTMSGDPASPSTYLQQGGGGVYIHVKPTRTATRYSTRKGQVKPWPSKAVRLLSGSRIANAGRATRLRLHTVASGPACCLGPNY